MPDWTAPQRPNSYTEQSLVNAILDGTFPAGSSLPGERTLSAQLGVTRPTLREAIQRLSRDGWLTVRQGKPTLVNNYWREGGLNVLSALVQYSQQLPPDFVPNLLEVRRQLAPAYTRAAVVHAPGEALACLNGYEDLADTAVAFAHFDWQLHHHLTIICGNPIYTLILNGFAGFYEELAQLYFARPQARQTSRQFYADLATAVSQQDATLAEQITREAMEQSLALWQNI
ncbi:MAG TPA: fatty acid metabolism transcriptional regulator FadR [Anaerolineae bacterium]|nr:fatty acid metabolism transcriptional regulator FadR [Anaerolineae bacterium]HIP71140.1 fatty acid metabolism transcriptional regulator FadR [Anaerolineae bacterium]